MNQFRVLIISVLCIYIVLLCVLISNVYKEQTTQKVSASVKIVFKCIDGKLYADSYLGAFIGEPQNVFEPKFQKSKNELITEDNITIECKIKD